jgi:hypothetical protein
VTATLGWVGCAVLVLSIAQSKPGRLRVLNLAASVVLMAYNIAIDAPPQVTMNAILALINVWQLVRLRDDRRSRKSPVPNSTATAR